MTMPFITSTNTNIGPTITYLDFINQSRQRIDAWLNRVTNSVYGDVFTVYQTAIQTIPSLSSTQILFNSGSKTNNCFSASQFKASSSGFYQFNGQIEWLDSFADGDATQLLITQNGVQAAVTEIRAYLNDKPMNTISLVLPANQGDIFQLQAYQTSGSNKRIGNQMFSGFFIRPL